MARRPSLRFKKAAKAKASGGKQKSDLKVENIKLTERVVGKAKRVHYSSRPHLSHRLEQWELSLARQARIENVMLANKMQKAKQITWKAADAIKDRFLKDNQTIRINAFKLSQANGEKFVGENPFTVLCEQAILDEMEARQMALVDGRDEDEAAIEFVRSKPEIDWDKVKRHHEERERLIMNGVMDADGALEQMYKQEELEGTMSGVMDVDAALEPLQRDENSAEIMSGVMDVDAALEPLHRDEKSEEITRKDRYFIELPIRARPKKVDEGHSASKEREEVPT